MFRSSVEHIIRLYTFDMKLRVNQLYCQTEILPQVLEDNGGSAGGGIVILVSDGLETGDLRISDVTPDLVRKGVIVDTIQIDMEDAVEMTQLAIDTNGRSFYDSGSSETTDLLSSLKSSIVGDDSAAPRDARIEVSCTLCRPLACHSS